jgi:transposase-like protein
MAAIVADAAKTAGLRAVPAAELCHEHGMSSATLKNWRAKYGGMDASLINEMKAIAEPRVALAQ